MDQEQHGPPPPTVPSGQPHRPTQETPVPTPRTRGSRNVDPRRPVPASQATAGLPDLLRIATEDALQYDIQNDGPSHYVPNLLIFYQVINAMDTQMASTKRFFETTAWCPFFSQAYFGILVMVYIMLLSSENGAIDPADQLLITWFFTNFKAEEILIPGPLVPFFQALAVCSAPFEGYGNVSPVLPRTCSSTQEHYYFLDHGHTHLLPGIPFLLESIRRFLNDGTDRSTPAAAATFDWRIGTMNSDPASVTANGWFQCCVLGPIGACSPMPNAAVAAALYQHRHAYLNLLPTFAHGNNTDQISWMQYFGFATTDPNPTVRIAWFSQLLGTMNRYAQFFKNSVRLDAIRKSGIGANLVLFEAPAQYALFDFTHITVNTPAAPPNPAVPGRITTRVNVSHDATAEHADSDLPDLAVQYAQVTMLNMDIATNAPAAVHARKPFPAVAHTRFGPVWNLTTVRRVVRRDPVPALNANIQTYYHTDTRIN